MRQPNARTMPSPQETTRSPSFGRVDTHTDCRARPDPAAPRTSGHSRTLRSSLPASREEGPARGLRPDLPAGGAAQLEGCNIDGAEPDPPGRAVEARKAVDVGRSCRVCLRRAMGSEALVPLDAARTFRYWQAVELLFYRLSATKRPIAIARRRAASYATARREVPPGIRLLSAC